MARPCIIFDTLYASDVRQLITGSVNNAADPNEFVKELTSKINSTYIVTKELIEFLQSAKRFCNTTFWSQKGITEAVFDQFLSQLKVTPLESLVQVNVVNLTELDENGDKIKTLPTDLSRAFKGYNILHTDFCKWFRGESVLGTIANLESRQIIEDDVTLNRNIASMKNRYFMMLVKYLEKITGRMITAENNTELKPLFNSDGSLDVNASSSLNKVLRLADNHFGKNGVQEIDLQRTLANMEVVNAFYAYMLLRGNNFDKMLSLFRKDVIKIDRRLGFLAPVSSNKYSFSTTKSIQKGLGTDRFAHSEVRAPKAAKDFIESLSIDTVAGKKFLKYHDVLNIINKALDLKNYRGVDPKIYDLVKNIHKSGIDGITTLLEKIINRENIGVALNYSSEDIQKLEVIYNSVYNPKGNSLRAIYAAKFRRNLLTSYNMLDNISNMLFRQNRRTYITYNPNSGATTYSKNYTMNTALRYLDQFNFEANQVEHFKTVIVDKNIKFADTDEKGNIISSNINMTLRLHDAEGNVTPVEFKFTPSGAMIVPELQTNFKLKFLGMGTYTKTLPLTMKQLAVYRDTKTINVSGNSEYEIAANTAKAKNFIAYLQFVSDMLPGIQLLGKDLGILNVLYTQVGASFIETLNLMVHSVAKASLINDAFYENSISSNLPLTLYQMLLSDKYKELKQKTKKIDKYIDAASGGFSVNDGAKIHPAILQFAEAAEVYLGNVGGTVRNNSGTDLPLTLQLIESLKFHANIATMEGSLSGNIILQERNERLVQAADVHFDETNYHKVTKLVKDLEESEFNYSMVVNRFYEGLVNSELRDSEKYIYVQPIVYESKGQFDVHKVLVNGWKINGKLYNFGDPNLKLSTILDLVFDRVGSTYRSIYSETLQDYRTIIKDNINFFKTRINELNNLTENKQDLIKHLQESDAIDAAKEQIAKQISDLDEEIDQRISDSLTTTDLQAKKDLLIFAMNNISPADVLSFSQCADLIAIITPEEFEDMAWSSGVDNVQQIHIGSRTTFTVGNGKASETRTGCGINKLLLYLGEVLFADRAVFDKFMEREKYKYIKDLLESDTRFQTIHSDFSENSIVTAALKKYGTELFESWEKFDELVLAKDLKGRNIYSSDQLVEGQMQMNPLLERFFLVDLLFRTSIRHLTVGTELGHANGYGLVIRDPETGEIDVEKTMEMEMSARNVSSLKRAVGETLPRSMITAGSVVTLPTVLRVAVMPDIKGHVFNISGDSKDIDAHDGSSFLNPLTAILINLGLAGNEGGEDLKGLLRAMNDRFGQAVLFKYASFSQYNERMRNSLSGNINMLHIFKKQTDIRWHSDRGLDGKPAHVEYDEVDLTSNLYGNKIHFSQITKGKPYYFKEGRKIYRVHSLVKGDGIDLYKLNLEEVVNENGDTRKVNTVERNVEIRSIWELYQAIGGCYSGYFLDSNFVMDDSSLHAVVGYMNNVGIVYNKEGIRSRTGVYLDSSSVYLPLKHCFIASCINQSGCKNGGNHLNSRSAWTDDKPLHTMLVKSDNWGLVQDYDHDVSVGKSVMTEFSQVMTALAAGSMMFPANEKVFKAITGYSIQKINNYLLAVNKFMDENLNEEGKSAVYDIIGKLIIRGAKREGTMSYALIDELTQIFKNNSKSGTVNHKNDSVHLPVSSPEMFVHYVTQMASVINRLSVKRKVPGLGGVMAPSYDVFTYFQLHVNNVLGLRRESKVTQSDLLKAIYDPQRIVNSDGSITYNIADRVKSTNVKIAMDLNNDADDSGKYHNYLSSITLTTDGFLSETSIGTTSDPLNRNKQLKNVLSFLSDLEPGQSFLVKSDSFLSLVLDALHKNSEDYLIKLFDAKTKSYTYTKVKTLPDTKAVKVYMDTLNYFNYSGLIHETERKLAEELSKTDEGNTDLSHLTAKRVKGTKVFTIKNPNLKTTDDLFVHDSIILADKNGNVQKDENGNLVKVTVSSYSQYKDLKSKELYFYTDLSASRNLQPSKAKFKAVNGKWYDLYDLPQVAKVFKEREEAGKNVSLQTLLEHRRILLPMLRMIDLGWLPVDEDTFNSVTDASSKLQAGDLRYLKIIDKNVEDAECVLPKLYAQQFGLRDGDSLADILELGSEFFNKRLREILDSVNYGKLWDVVFVNGDKNHRYIRFNIPSNARREEIEDAYVDIVKNKVKREDGTEMYEYRKVRVDAEGSRLYTLQIAYKDIKANDNEELLWEDYIVPLESSTGEETFYCAKPEAAAELYSKSDYNGVRIKSSKEQFDTVKLFIKQMHKNNIDLLNFDFSGVEKGKNQETKKQRDAIVDSTLDSIENLEELVDKVDSRTNTRFNGNGVKIFNSFKLSLEMLVARIPAQSLLSFMKMRVVGFSDSNKNSIMVSHYQLWLQGSDYDIDKAYAMGYEFANGGIFVGWSPYFSLSRKSDYTTSLELPLPSGNNVTYVNIKNAKDNVVNITDILQSDIFKNVIIPSKPSSFTAETLKAIKVLLDRIGDAKLFTFDTSIFKTYLPKGSKARLKAIEENNKYIEDCANYLKKIINAHTRYFSNAFTDGKPKPNRPSANVVGMAYKNCISYNALKISAGVVNILDSNAPISMDVPKEAANNSTLGKESMKMTQYTPSYISKMVRTFMVGKDGIGIAANGEKVFFSLLYYYTDIITKGKADKIKNALFNKQYVFGKSKFTRNIIANVNLDYIQGIDLSILASSKTFIKQTINALYAGNYENPEDLVVAVEEQLKIGHDQALVISALLSAATDNAKELILAKIGADTKYMNMYIYCIVLGIPFLEISTFMTSPIASLIMELGRDNMYDEFQLFKCDGDTTYGAASLISDGLWDLAPNSIARYMTKELYEECFKSGTDLPVSYYNIEDFAEGSTYNAARIKRFLDLHYKVMRTRKKVMEDNPDLSMEELDEYIKEQTAQFIDIRRGGQELTNLSTLLGLNQGIPVTLEDSLNKYVQIENIFIKGISKAYNVYKGLSSYEKLYAVDLNIVNDFDFDRFMSDEMYRNVCVKMWNNAKHTFNIFEVITTIPHIWNLYKMWHASEVGKKAMTIKYSKAVLIKLAIGTKKLTKGEISRLTKVLHDTSIFNWITSQNISIPIKKGLRYLKNERYYTADLDFNMKLNTRDGLATFKHWFETYAFSNLTTRGTMDGVGKNLDVVSNLFISNIVVSTELNTFTGRRSPLITFNTDFAQIEELGNTRDIYNIISSDFARLAEFSFNNMSYIDWFYLYNLVANKNMYGPLRILPIFATLKQKTKLIAEYEKQIGNGDYEGIDSIGTIDIEDYLVAISPTATPNGAVRTNSKYVRVWNVKEQCYNLFKKVLEESSRDFSDFGIDVDEGFYVEEPDIDYETQDTSLTVPGYKYIKSLGDSVYNSYYTFGNKGSIELFNKYGLDTDNEELLRLRLFNLFKDNILTMYINC